MAALSCLAVQRAGLSQISIGGDIVEVEADLNMTLNSDCNNILGIDVHLREGVVSTRGGSGFEVGRIIFVVVE